MTNEEHIEEILIEASAFNLREEVLELSKDLRETNPHLNRLDSIQLAYIELYNSINQ
jgi:hypothetical protein